LLFSPPAASRTTRIGTARPQDHIVKVPALAGSLFERHYPV
jgi:hypothetical protein